MRILAALILTATTAFAGGFPYMGNWQGKITGGPHKGGTVSAKVVGIGDEHYRVVLTVDPLDQDVEIFGMGKGSAAAFVGEVDLGEEIGEAVPVIASGLNEKITGAFVFQEEGSRKEWPFSLSKIIIESPTAGAEPPEGAIVLFDGNNLDAWNMEPPLLDGGIMHIIHKHAFESKESFGDAKYHIEFQCPHMPDEEGQGRGNSGVYIHHRYEVQVLDSFGDPPADNRCGGIYKVAVPMVNASLPPWQWQTYDITFHSPRFDENGEKTENARITVYHNGVLIHDDVEIPAPTGGAISEDEVPEGPLFFQLHGDPVMYRNIWVLPLDE